MNPTFLLVVSFSLAISAPVDDLLDSEWNQFKTAYKRQYELNEDRYRKMVFVEKLWYIQKHNTEADMGKHSFRLGVNEYADWTNQEFRRGYILNQNSSEGATYLRALNLNQKLPDSVDWRTKGYVTPVKNQGQFGASWLFSALDSLDGQLFRKTGHLVDLSEQQLTDCMKGPGSVDGAFQYIKDTGGIDSSACYPPGKPGVCRFNSSCIVAKVTGFVDVKSGNEADLESAVAEVGPVSVYVDASHASFQLYRSGVYDEPSCSSTMLDHAMLVVGYGALNGKDYWIVKNSWGTTWGMRGYILMSRNKDNQCGIATMSSYPLVLARNQDKQDLHHTQLPRCKCRQ